MDLSTRSGTNWIAVFFMSQATLLALAIFFAVRFDGRMQLLALGAAISQTSALATTAGVILTGRVLTDKSNPADLPPGSVVSNKETVQTPPVTNASNTP